MLGDAEWKKWEEEREEMRNKKPDSSKTVTLGRRGQCLSEGSATEMKMLLEHDVSKIRNVTALLFCPEAFSLCVGRS